MALHVGGACPVKKKLPMSMPQYMNVVVISRSGILAGVAASVLRGPDTGGINPHVTAARASYETEMPRFFVTGAVPSYPLVVATPCHLLDPSRVDLWLALDDYAEKEARIIVSKGSAAPGFYRTPFPDPVLRADFDIAPLPSAPQEIDPWLDVLAGQLQPWKERIWTAFYNSS